MSDFDALLRKPLAAGGHPFSWDGEQCVMERVALLWAMHTGQDVASVFSDLPTCTNEVIAKAAQAVNDNLSDEGRQRLNAFLPRLLRARRTDSDLRVNVRLAVWAARRVLHLVREQDREVCEQAIRATELWLAGECGEDEVRARAANANANANATAAAAASAAAAAATAAYANAAAADPIVFLDEMLDQWEEAVTKEGEDLYIPREWEDDALVFVAEYVGESETP